MRRRHAMGTAAAVLGAGLLGRPALAAAARSIEDAALLALCGEYQSLARTLDESPAGRLVVIPPELEAGERRLLDVLDELAAAIALRPAATVEGVRAKATVVRRHLGVTMAPDPAGQDALGWSLLHDVLGEATGWPLPAEGGCHGAA